MRFSLVFLHLFLLCCLVFIIPSKSAQAPTRPKGLILPVTKDPSTLQYITQIKQRTPLVPVKLAVDLGGQFLWVDCDKDYTTSTYRPSRCNPAQCSLAKSTSCTTECYSPARPGCTNNTCSLFPENAYAPIRMSCLNCSSDSWKKVHVGASKCKTTPFPHFDELSIIFGKDRATGLNAESVFEAEEDINAVEAAAAATLEGGQGGFPDMDSFMQNSDESTCRVGSKRKKVDVDPTIEAMYAASKMIATEFANSTRVIASEFASSTKMLIAAETDRLEKKEKLSEELSKISGINVLEKFQAAKKIADSETLMVLFFGAPDEEKYELVHAILRGEI